MAVKTSGVRGRRPGGRSTRRSEGREEDPPANAIPARPVSRRERSAVRPAATARHIPLSRFIRNAGSPNGERPT